MYKNKSIAVIIPCYNESSQIGNVITTMPDYIDYLVIVDDASRDDTAKVVEMHKKINDKNDKIVFIRHERNQGVGGAMVSGYKWVKDSGVNIAVRIDGDGQMDINDLPALLDPVVTGEVDCAKGNRLLTKELYRKMPKVRYLGNAVLSMLNKIASGYWHIADSQTGYTVVNRKVLEAIKWDDMYKRYGQPNDLLVRLNVFNFRVRDVEVAPVYGIGERSSMKIHWAVFTISWLLLKLFLWRLKEKYIIRDFHPLVFFYFLGFSFGLITIVLSIRTLFFWHISGKIPPINTLTLMFSFMSSSIFTLFAMWFDMEVNKDLK